MSYQKRTDIPSLETGEVAVELDTGEIVAVCCEAKRNPETNLNTYYARARHLNPDGTPALDSHGLEVIAAFTHGTTPAEFSALGDDGLTREAVMLLLGEPTSGKIGWPDDFKASTSIRFAIASAAVTGHPDNLHELL